jgi:guanylate kinase
MTPYVITLTGPSRCGKSQVIELLYKIGEDKGYADFHPVLAPKFTTRSFRNNEIESIKTKDSKELDVLPVIGEYNEIEGIDETKLNEMRMRAFKAKNCDLAYEQYGNRYGLRLEDIYSRLKEGKTPIVILNDVRTVEDIKIALGRQCFSIFVFREVPDIGRFEMEGMQRNETVREIKARFEKADAIYRIYIENIHIFDKLVLNVIDGYDDLERILRQLVERLCRPVYIFK